MTLSSLREDLNSSLKKGDAVRVQTIRFLLSAINNYAIAKYANESETKLKEEDILEVIKKQVKTHKESIEAFTNAKRMELANKESAELSILESFLPAEMTDTNLRKILTPIAASGEANFGLLMKNAMTAVNGQADGGRVSKMLREMTIN